MLSGFQEVFYHDLLPRSMFCFVVPQDVVGDHEVTSGLVSIVWAYGGTDAVGYHGSNRGSAGVVFVEDINYVDGVPGDADENELFSLTVPGINIPIDVRSK